MAKDGNKRDFGEHATTGGNKHEFGEYATNGGNKRDFGEHATKSGYISVILAGNNLFSFQFPTLPLPRYIRKISLAISGAHELKFKVFRVQQPFLLPISFRPSTHSPEPAHSPPNSPRSFIRYIHRNTPFPSARSAKKNMVLYLAYYIYFI